MLAKELIIREPIRDDRQQLTELIKEEVLSAQRIALYYSVPKTFDWSEYSDWKLKDTSRKYFVAQCQGSLAGFIEIHNRAYQAPVKNRSTVIDMLRRRKRSAMPMPIDHLKWAVIEACFVSPSWRNKGVGRALVGVGLTWLRQRGIRRVELGVLSTNSAVVFWERLGFDTWRINMCKDLADDPILSGK